MSVLGLVNNRIAWLLKRWCCKFLEIDTDTETWAVQLSSRPVVIGNVSLNKDAFNTELERYGLQMIQGYVSKIELVILEWSNLSASIGVETLTVRLKLMDSDRVRVESGSGDENTSTGSQSGRIWWKSLMSNIEAWLKRFLANLRILIQRVIIDLTDSEERRLVRLSLCDIGHETELKTEDSGERMTPHTIVESFQFLIPDREDKIQKILQLDNLDFRLSTSDGCGFRLDSKVGKMAMDLTPDILKNLLSILAAFKEHITSRAIRGAVVYTGSEFDDTSNRSQGRSSFYSDSVESVYYDCQEEAEETIGCSCQFGVAVERCTLLLHSDTVTDGISGEFLARVERLACTGEYNGGLSMAVSVNRMRFSDQSPGARLLHQLTPSAVVPDCFHSILSSNEAVCASFVQLNPDPASARPSLTAKLKWNAREQVIDIATTSIEFSTSCESFERTLVLFRELYASVSPDSGIQNSPSALSDFEIQWHTRELHGVLEQIRVGSEALDGIWLFETTSKYETPFLSCRHYSSDHRFLSPSASISLVIAFSEAIVHEAVISERNVRSCHTILFCKPSDAVISPLRSDVAISMEVTQFAVKRPTTSDLSSLAYALEHIYSQADSTFSERTLSRVQYEGKCVQSADLIYEVTLDSIALDLTVHSVEALTEVLLQFWNPSKLVDRSRTMEQKQTVSIIKAQGLRCRCSQEAEQDGHQWECNLKETEILSVSNVERETISTLSISVGDFRLDGPEGCLCRLGSDIDDDDDFAAQFFQVSELDFRNAKLKQWASLQLAACAIRIDRSVLALKWMAQCTRELVDKNKDRIQTDIEVETIFSLSSENIHFSYSAMDVEQETTLNAHVNRAKALLKNGEKLTAEIRDLSLFITLPDYRTRRCLDEKLLHCSLRLAANELDAEIKNDDMKIDLDPETISSILYIARSLQDYFPTPIEVGEQNADGPLCVMEHIDVDAFSVDGSHEASLPSTPFLSNIVMESDGEDDYVLIDDVDSRRDLDLMRASQTSFLNGEQLIIRDDYIAGQDAVVDEDDAVQESSSDNLPSSQCTVRFVNFRGTSFFGQGATDERVSFSVEGLSMTYTAFQPGSHYKSRLVVAIQEIEATDHLTQEQERRIVERHRSQLRTQCHKRTRQQQTLTSAMVYLTIETVLPDVEFRSRLMEKRVELRIVPLRLRLSRSLTDFTKLFFSQICSPLEPDNDSAGCYVQMCTVTSFYVVVDYRPRRIDFDRLKNGKTSELANVVQWEGLEFFLDEMKMTGILGFGSLLSNITQNWAHDISHSKKYRLLGGLPALGALKRISPAAQDVLKATVAKVTREPVEQQIRGTCVTKSVSLRRALGEFGRVCSLEVLNLCAQGTEGVQLVINGSDGPPDPSNAREGLHHASETLKRAANSIVTEPFRSIQSGEGAAVAVSKALRAMPRASLAPVSAAATVIHGTLRGACDALDSEHVLKS